MKIARLFLGRRKQIRYFVCIHSFMHDDQILEFSWTRYRYSFDLQVSAGAEKKK